MPLYADVPALCEDGKPMAWQQLAEADRLAALRDVAPLRVPNGTSGAAPSGPTTRVEAACAPDLDGDGRPDRLLRFSGHEVDEPPGLAYAARLASGALVLLVAWEQYEGDRRPHLTSWARGPEGAALRFVSLDAAMNDGPDHREHPIYFDATHLVVDAKAGARRVLEQRTETGTGTDADYQRWREARLGKEL